MCSLIIHELLQQLTYDGTRPCDSNNRGIVYSALEYSQPFCLSDREDTERKKGKKEGIQKASVIKLR